MHGVYVAPVAGAPFSATVEMVSRQKLADGSIEVLKTVNYIARDSRGRTYNENRRLVAAEFEKEPLLNTVRIYDPATNLASDLDPLTHLAKQTRRITAPQPHPASVPSPDPDDPNSQFKQVDLGTKMFKGILLKGIRQERGADRADEFWYSPDLSIYMSRKHKDPIWDQTVSVTDFERAEPDSSLFVVPDDYRIVEVAETRNTQSLRATNAADILSDTKGVSFDAYIKQVIEATRKTWFPLIPGSARPPSNKAGRVAIRFKIYPDGHVKEMLLEIPSGDLYLDRAAWGGVNSAAPYPPLPQDFKGPFLQLRLNFYYNLDLTRPLARQ
jgi:TonB family protein